MRHRATLRLAIASLVASAGALASLAAAPTALANWNEPAAGSLNVDPTHDTIDPASITSIGGAPYAAFAEASGSPYPYQVRVKALGASGWNSVGGPLNVDSTKNARGPSIANVGGVPYVAWFEANASSVNQIRVKAFDGTNWNNVGGSLNNSSDDAENPRITSINGVPYVAWEEANVSNPPLQIHVRRWNGSAWVPAGSSLNVNPGNDARDPSIASVGGVPFVTWEEASGSQPTSSPTEIRVKSFDGATWNSVGGPLNVDTTKDARYPSIATVGGTPYVAWQEDFRVDVKSWDGSAFAWNAVGSSLGGLEPDIMDLSGHPFVAFYQGNGPICQVVAAISSGGGWNAVGGPLNVDPTKNAYCSIAPGVTGIGGVPYVAWNETNGTAFQALVKRLEPDIGSESATASPTGATLSAQVNDFGVPLPVGFEYGPTSSFGQQTPLQSTPGGGTSTLTQTLTGLSPATTYFYRAFGSDTVRQTSLGTTQRFLTPTLLPASSGTPSSKATLSQLSETNSVFAVGPSSTPLSAVTAAKRHKRGTIFSFRLDRAATIKIAIQTKAPGRRVRHQCRPASRRLRHKPRCTRTVTIVTLARAAHDGVNKVTFSGRVPGKALKPGRYRAVFTAIDGAGASAPKSLGFTIVKR